MLLRILGQFVDNSQNPQCGSFTPRYLRLQCWLVECVRTVKYREFPLHLLIFTSRAVTLKGEQIRIIDSIEFQRFLQLYLTIFVIDRKLGRIVGVNFLMTFQADDGDECIWWIWVATSTSLVLAYVSCCWCESCCTLVTTTQKVYFSCICFSSCCCLRLMANEK